MRLWSWWGWGTRHGECLSLPQHLWAGEPELPGQEGATLRRGPDWRYSDMTISEVTQGLLSQAMAIRAVPGIWWILWDIWWSAAVEVHLIDYLPSMEETLGSTPGIVSIGHGSKRLYYSHLEESGRSKLKGHPWLHSESEASLDDMRP